MRRLVAALVSLAPLLSPVSAGAGAELVMFERDGCVWCRRWHEQVGKAYPLTDEGRCAPLVSHSLDRRQPPPVKLIEPVRYTPTFVLALDGVERARITGYQDEASFFGLLARYLDEQKVTGQHGR
jgi:hypothetical protein